MLFRAANRPKNASDSVCGATYAFLTVGPNPRRSTMVSTITAQVGSEVKYHNGRDDIAAIKNSQSVRVMVISAHFTYASTAINAVIVPDTPIGHAPTPPPD